MPEPINGHDFAGAHPTCREFVARLTALGVHPAPGRSRAHHLARPPSGTLRVTGPSWAALARDLGYADQAHLTRNFTATIGCRRAVTLLRRYAAAIGTGLTKSPT